MTRRRRRERDALEMVAFAARAIQAASRHVADADEFELAEFAALRAVLEDGMRAAVQGQMRATGRSWAYIGAALGIRRQSAQQRYGGEAWGHERRPGARGSRGGRVRRQRPSCT